MGGASTAGLAAAACSPNDEASSADGTASSVSDFEELVIPFSGEHQAGIITPMQNNMHFAAFDVDEEIDRDDLIDLLTRWTKASRRLTMGGDVTAKGAFGGGENFPPDDSGEAVDLGPSGLTITFGFGKNLFRKQFGLEGKLPKEFTDMPKMTNDFTDQDHSHGDICIMACANDPQVAGHAIRNLTRLGVPDAVLRWTQIGFGRASVTSREEKTPRNLFGQKDGTANIRSDETDTLNEHVWIPENSSQSWAAGGSYMTVRRIRMLTEIWDTLQLQEQERVTGRDKHEGAPLSGGDEFTEPDFDAKDERGLPKIDHESHLFNVHPNQNGGIKMLRRAFNFIDGSDEQGRLLAGLFFIGFTKTVDRFATVHQSMSRDMMFVEYCKTTNTGTYLVPPGIGDGDDDFIGQQMFA
nr:Dyp-type peroxidase [Corynebacterium aquatimens]